ncbi:MAG TPA: LuxR C-terminal-related transcriptional regulator [Streptosporangiaceae bacterium]
MVSGTGPGRAGQVLSSGHAGDQPPGVTARHRGHSRPGRRGPARRPAVRAGQPVGLGAAAAAAVRADQGERLALLDAEALPLLRGIAGGTLAVTDPDVRQRCASYAATLWRALVDRADDPGGLLAELAPVLSLARDRGTLAEVQVVGDPGAPPREVTSATVAAVDGVLRALPPHPVTLTVLADEEPATVRAAITAVAAGQDWISPRLAYILATDDAPDRPGRSPQEERALRLYATGMPMKSVARRMGLSEETVKQYVGRVREKYARAGRAAPTKIELYHRAVEDGYLPLPPPP